MSISGLYSSGDEIRADRTFDAGTFVEEGGTVRLLRRLGPGTVAGTSKNETDLGPSFLRSPFPVGPKSGTYFQCLLAGAGVLSVVLLVAMLVLLLGRAVGFIGVFSASGGLLSSGSANGPNLLFSFIGQLEVGGAISPS